MSKDAREKVKAAVRALQDWEEQLDTKQYDLESREADVALAELHVEDILERAADLREALAWASDPNPAMGRAEQRLVLRTLLFNVEPAATFRTIAALAERMLP